MSNYWARVRRWRDLDLAQMHLWPNAPRRWTVAILAALLLGLCVFYFILPRYERLAEEQKQVLNTQNQIIKAYQTTPLSLSDIPPIRQIKRDQESVWLSDLASLARKHHLHSIAFPAISTGAYAYPLDEAARIALLTCTEWINANADYGMSVVLTCFNSGVYNAYQEFVKKAQNGELD